jgi:hypothetical protein
MAGKPFGGKGAPPFGKVSGGAPASTPTFSPPETLSKSQGGQPAAPKKSGKLFGKGRSMSKGKR